MLLNKTQMKTDPADKLWLFQMIRDPRHLLIQQEHLWCTSKLYAGNEKWASQKTRYLEGHTLREFWVFLQVPSSQNKQRNQTIEFPWELYCLVVLFLLLYVICASVPTKGTRILRWLVLIFSCVESLCTYNQLCTHKTWQTTNMAACSYFCAIFLHSCARLLLACFKYNSCLSHSVYIVHFKILFWQYIISKRQLFLCSIDLWVLCDAYHKFFYFFGDFYASGTQDAEVTKSLSVLQAKK